MSTIIRPDAKQVCYCGHPVSRHELQGTVHARCRLWLAGQTCNCSMSATPIIQIEEITSAGMRRFQRKERGWESPGAFQQAIGNAEASGNFRYHWMIDTCDRCNAIFDMTKETLYIHAVDVDGTTIMAPKRPRVNGATINADTGKYIAVCFSCELIDLNPDLSDSQLARLANLKKINLIGYRE